MKDAAEEIEVGIVPEIDPDWPMLTICAGPPACLLNDPPSEVQNACLTCDRQYGRPDGTWVRYGGTA